MQRRGEQAFGRSDLDHGAKIDDRDPVGDMPDKAKIVGYEDDSEPEPFLQIHEQVNHLRLNRDIEGGNQFIGDQANRFDGEGTRDRYALTLSPRKFMRIFLD
jgi:hypothetical protein